MAPGSYVIRDARKWEVDPERTASKFDAGHYGGLLEKAWGEGGLHCYYPDVLCYSS